MGCILYETLLINIVYYIIFVKVLLLLFQKEKSQIIDYKEIPWETIYGETLSQNLFFFAQKWS